RGRVIDTGLLEGCGAEKVQDRPEPEPGLGLGPGPGPGPGSGSQSGPAQPHALIQTQRQVQRLDGGTGRALDQVVQGRDDGGLTAAFVYEGTDADGVGTGGLPGGGEGALLEQGHEVLLSIVGVQRSEEVGGGDLAAHPCGADRQDASAHRHQHRGEGQPGVLMSRRTAQVLQDLGNVPVAAADRVGSRGAGALGEHQMLFGGASGSRVADLQHRAERGRVDQLCPHERRQGEGDGGGVAAGHGDLARAGRQLALRGAGGTGCSARGAGAMRPAGPGGTARSTMSWRGRVSVVVSARIGSWRRSMGGATSLSRWPALECAAAVVASMPGCALSRRKVSPPAYPEAPTTAARKGPPVDAGEATACDAEVMPEVYTLECMNSQCARWSPLS